MTIIAELSDLRDRGMTIRDRAIEAASLAHVELGGLRADSLVLRDVDLRGSKIDASDWTGCTFVDVRIDRATASNAILRLCTFERVRAADCDLTGAKLENCTAIGIVLDRAVLAGGALVDSDLTRASLCDAILREVDASAAILRGADLRGADLRGASLVDADLRGADLRGARLDDADLDGADLRGAVLDDDDFAGAEAEAEPAAPSALPPGFAVLADAVGPLVADVLKHGRQRGVLGEAALDDVLGQLGALGIDAKQPSPLCDDGLRNVLRHVSTTGIAPLLAALHSGGNEPPPELATLIHSLMRDAGLGGNATADDLVVHLLGQLRSFAPTR